ncbi:DUF123 domain-containing protein [candidate division KSB1 bacterium]
MKKGIYCLVIRVNRDISVHIGALELRRFAEGYYIYVGSAQNNLDKRIQRHLASEKRIHWHIDRLLAEPSAEIVGVFYKAAAKEHECSTASRLMILGQPEKDFGSSDCACKSHLIRMFHYDKFPFPDFFEYPPD